MARKWMGVKLRIENCTIKALTSSEFYGIKNYIKQFRTFTWIRTDCQSIIKKSGAVAQVGERLNGIQEVVGSIPISSTKIVRG